MASAERTSATRSAWRCRPVFFIDAQDVAFGGAGGDAQLLGYVADGMAGAEQAQDARLGPSVARALNWDTGPVIIQVSS